MPLDDLVDALLARARPLGAKPRRAAAPSPIARGLPADDAPIAPSDIARAINDLFDRHGAMPMTSDIGDCLFTAMEIENTDAGRARLLRRHGLRRAGRHRRRSSRPAGGR